jgi:methionyl-tRNA synthetase
VLVSPFMPGKSQALWEALGQAGPITDARWDAAVRPALGGATVRKPEGLFPKPLPA